MGTLNTLSSAVLKPILSAESMQVLDVKAKEFLRESTSIEDTLLAGYEYMKQAGNALFELVKSKGLSPIAIFIGSGNNGGDGLVLANLLKIQGIPATVFSVNPIENFKNEAKYALDDYLNSGGILEDLSNIKNEMIFRKPVRYQLIVDCMLGINQKGELRENYAKIVKEINEWNIPIIAADSPTGYDSHAHKCASTCIHATETILFGFPRLDAYLKGGKNAFGKVSVASLNYPNKRVCNFTNKINVLDIEAIKELLPNRDEWGDKRVQGSALIIAGSSNMPGAAYLCSKAALRSGSGLITLASPDSIIPVLQTKLSEVVFCNLHEIDGQNSDFVDDKAVSFASAHIPKLLNLLVHNQALAIGPGLGLIDSTCEAVIEMLPQVNVPMVVDADALNAIATLNKTVASKTSGAFSYLLSIKQDMVLTPHRREFERLFGSLPENDFEIPHLLQDLSCSLKKVILLKGFPTFIACPDREVYVLPFNNSGLAKGGSGDVLTGIIVSLLSQRLNVNEAAVLGALLLQKAGEITRKKMGAFGMIPSDVIENLPFAFLN